jgi:hypothetical protein
VGLVEGLFRDAGLVYRGGAPMKSDLFADLLGRISSGSAALLDHPRLREQLLLLEARTTASGRERIMQPRAREAHDDLANAAAGAVFAASGTRKMTIMEAMALAEEGYTREQLNAHWRFSKHLMGLRMRGLA